MQPLQVEYLQVVRLYIAPLLSDDIIQILKCQSIEILKYFKILYQLVIY